MLSTLLAVLLLTSGILAATPNILTSTERDTQIAKWKEQVSKRGVGEQSKWTVELADGRKLKGYTGEIREDGFTLVDLKTGESHPINYNDINRLNPNVGMSQGAQIALTAGIVAGAVFGVLAVLTRGDN
jgi:hypothetical protein